MSRNATGMFRVTREQAEGQKIREPSAAWIERRPPPRRGWREDDSAGGYAYSPPPRRAERSRSTVNDPSAAPVPSFVDEWLRALGVAATEAQRAALAGYLGRLLEANRAMNLTAVREPESAWRAHVIDSLTLAPGLGDLPAGARLADVGSGGGAPGIPLAIVRPDIAVTLFEATGKKACFLDSCARALGLGNVRVVAERSETAGRDPAHREAFDVVACRALGRMPVLLELTLPLARVGGAVWAMKGPEVERELEAAADAIDALGGGEVEVFDAYPEGFDIHTTIVVVAKAGRTPRGYPRRPGEPKRAPL